MGGSLAADGAKNTNNCFEHKTAIAVYFALKLMAENTEGD